jgi:Rrf2 family protein
MMSKKCKYAIKALISLSENYQKGNLFTAAIAKEQNIPKKFLEQILLDLKHAGFVGSSQGYKGGYYLIKEPKEINLAEVYRVFDGAIALVPCVSVNYYEKCDDCTDELTCTLKREFGIIKEQTRQIMKGINFETFLK